MKKRLPMKVSVAILSAAMIMSGVPVSALSSGIQIASVTAFAAEDAEQEQCPTPTVTGSFQTSVEGYIIATSGMVQITYLAGYDTYYTLDGTDPSPENGTRIQSAITQRRVTLAQIKNAVDENNTTTLKVIRTKEGAKDSEILTVQYMFAPDTVVPIGSQILKQAILESLHLEQDISVPLTKEEMLKVESLDLSNRSTGLAGLEYALNLKSLDLSGNPSAHNALSSLGQTMFNKKLYWKNLETINLSNCNLTAIDVYFSDALLKSKSLKSVDLSNNKLSGVFSFPCMAGTYPYLTKLETINLSNNELNGMLVPTTWGLHSIQKIDLSGNRVYLDENAGEWYSSAVKIGLEKFVTDTDKSFTELISCSKGTIDSQSKVIDFGTVNSDTISFNLLGYQNLGTLTAKIKETGLTFNVKGYATDSANVNASLELKPGENIFTLELKYINGDTDIYTLKANSSYAEYTLPRNEEGSAEIKDKSLYQTVLNLLNAGKYKTEPKIAGQYDITKEDMASLTALTVAGVNDCSGIEYATGLKTLNLSGEFENEIDVSGLTGLTSLTLNGKFHKISGLENLKQLNTLNLTGKYDKLIGLNNLTTLKTLTLCGESGSAKDLQVPENVTTLTVNLAADGTLPDMAACATKLATVHVKGVTQNPIWITKNFSKLSKVYYYDIENDLETPGIESSVDLKFCPFAKGGAEYKLDISTLCTNTSISWEAPVNYIQQPANSITITGKSEFVKSISGVVAGEIHFSEDFSAHNLTAYSVRTVSGIVEIPDSTQVPMISALMINSGKFEDGKIPAQIGDMVHLTSIQINDMPSVNAFAGNGFRNLKDLQKIRIVGLNNLSGEITTDWFPNDSIQEIYIVNTSLSVKDGTDTDRNWEKLTSLVLSNDAIKEIPSELIKHASALRTLRMYSGQYTEIPEDTFANCVNLTQLDLGDYLPYKYIDSEWVLDPDSSAAKAVARLEEINNKVAIYIYHTTDNGGGYAALTDMKVLNGSLSGDVWRNSDLVIQTEADADEVIFIPTSLYPDTVITVNGKEYHNGDTITAELVDTNNVLRIICTNAYSDNMVEEAKEEYEINIVKGEYIENFQAEEGKVYNVPVELRKINGTVSMSNGYFQHIAQVRLVNGKYDVRLTTTSASYITDMMYPYHEENIQAVKVSQSGSNATYQFFTDTLEEPLTVTPRVSPMGNMYVSAYAHFDLTKVIDVTDSVGADTAVLEAAIIRAETILDEVAETRNVYTEGSYQAMNDALAGARELLNLASPTQNAINKAAKVLNDAIDALEIDESKLADKTTLEEALTTAKALTKGKHTDTNWEALQEAIADAQEVYDDIYATTKEANAAAKALNNAIKAFNSSGESSTMDPASLEDGVYTVYVDMINATDTAQKSMSDGAITKPVTITVKDGEYTMTANFHGIYVTLGGQSLFGYLKELSYWDGEKYAPVTVDSTYDVVDDFNDADEDKVADYKYPHQMTFPLVNKNKGDDEKGYVHVQVFVPIMEALSAGSGTQQALMKIDWTSLAEGDEAANEAIRTEKARNELAQTIAEANEIGAKGYTAESYQALTDAVRAGEALMKNTEAKKADYTAANERIKAAMAALEEAVVSKDALQRDIDTANEKLAETDLYTTDSVAALQTAAAKAAEVLKNADATQKEVDQAAADLTKAIEGLKVIDRTPLKNAIADAKQISADTYTPNSYQSLTDEITAADAILKQDKVTDDEITAAVNALKAATAGLIKRADFTKLQNAYDEAAAIENQKQPGWDVLQTALANAKNVLDDANATQAQVTDQINAIRNAVANLGAGIDKSLLASMIEEANALDTSKYSDESVKAFQAAIAAAEKVNDDEDATQQDIEKQIQMLDNAAKALIQKEEQGVVYDGTYTIDGWLYHASADQYSMGNAALAKPLQVVVKDGKATLRMEFQPLTTSLGKTEFTGYLALLNYFPEWEGGENGFSAPTGETPVATTVEKYYENTYDSYNDPENGTDKNIKGQLYPHILSMPVELGDAEIWVQVYVPVMESISEGSGLQYAKLQLDWNSLEQVSGTETDKSALNTALEQAKALADSLKEGDPGYTEENLNTLQSAIANGQKVADSFNVNQTAVDAATQALQSAMDLFNEAPVLADKTELAEAIYVADTYLNDKTSGYSEASLATLQTARDNAAKVNDDPEATQTQVNAAVTAIDNAIQSLTIDKADKSALKDALDAAADILSSSDDYSPAEKNVLQNAYDAAQAVFDDDKASQEDVDAQTNILNTLVGSISPVTPAAVEKAGLHDVLLTAANMLGRDSTFTLATRHALKKAIKAGEKVFDDPDATQEEVNAAANDVVDAMLDLEVKEGFFNRPDDSQTDDSKTDDGKTDGGKTDDGKTDDGKTDDGKTDDGKTDDGKTDDGKTNDGKTDDGKADADSTALDNKDLADGVYVVNGNMVKVNKTDASMSDKAINHNIKLTVKDGKYYVTMDFNGLTVGNQLGYLGSLKYFTTGYTTNGYGAPQGSTADAAVDTYQTNADGSKVSDNYGTDYPDQVTFELIPEALEDGYVPLQVFVPIMESISTGSGTQPVYLALDWSTIQKTTADDEAFQSEDPAGTDATPAVDLTDEATGIHVTAAAGVLPEGVKLVVVPVTEGTDYDTAKANTFIAGNNFNLYDIHFEDAEGNEVEPNGRVTVSVPVPEDWDSTRLTVYHFNDNGSVTPIIGSVSDGMYTFYTTSFSDYALVERKTGTLTPNTNLNSGADNGSTGSGLTGNTLVAGTDGTDGTKGSSLSGGTSSLSGSGSSLGSSGGSGTTSLSGVKTGDESRMGGWLAMMLIAAGALAVLLAERRRVSAR